MVAASGKYAVGKRVYRGGSDAPTRGTVDPTGYVERELQSQRRSSLAQAALRRLGTGAQPVDKRVAPQGAYPPSAMAPQFQRAERKYQPIPQERHNGMTGHGDAAITQAPHVNPSPPSMTPTPPTVSPTGQLSLALPFDPEIASQQAELGYEHNNTLAQLLEGRQGAEREATVRQAALERLMPNARRDLLNNFSGRGMAFSSGYGMGVGEQENEFATQRAGILDQLTGARNNYDRGVNSANEQFNQRLALLQQILAQRAAQRAGTLNLAPTAPATGQSPIPRPVTMDSPAVQNLMRRIVGRKRVGR